MRVWLWLSLLLSAACVACVVSQCSTGVTPEASSPDHDFCVWESETTEVCCTVARNDAIASESVAGTSPFPAEVPIKSACCQGFLDIHKCSDCDYGQSAYRTDIADPKSLCPSFCDAAFLGCADEEYDGGETVSQYFVDGRAFCSAVYPGDVVASQESASCFASPVELEKGPLASCEPAGSGFPWEILVYVGVGVGAISVGMLTALLVNRFTRPAASASRKKREEERKRKFLAEGKAEVRAARRANAGIGDTLPGASATSKGSVGSAGGRRRNNSGSAARRKQRDRSPARHAVVPPPESAELDRPISGISGISAITLDAPGQSSHAPSQPQRFVIPDGAEPRLKQKINKLAGDDGYKLSPNLSSDAGEIKTDDASGGKRRAGSAGKRRDRSPSKKRGERGSAGGRRKRKTGSKEQPSDEAAAPAPVSLEQVLKNTEVGKEKTDLRWSTLTGAENYVAPETPDFSYLDEMDSD